MQNQVLILLMVLIFLFTRIKVVFEVIENKNVFVENLIVMDSLV